MLSTQTGITIYMTQKHKSKARLNERKLRFTESKKALSSQSGLVPVVRFLNEPGLPNVLGQRIDIDRGSNAIYQLSDAILLTTIGIAAGARSLIKTCSVWQDRVLRECARWRHIPSDSHLGRLFKLFNFQKVAQLETVVHQMRGRAWKKALRSGVSKIYAFSCITVDLGSTVKTVFGHQEGAEKGYSYLVKVSMKNLTQLLIKQNWEPIIGRPGWESCEFQHQCGSWTESRRFVAVRQKKTAKPKEKQGELLSQEPEYDHFCYVTSESLSPRAAHKEYGKRATCETWIEECKNQMALGQIKSSDFMASSALMQCSILAYNAVRWMALLSGNQQLMKWEPESIRCYIIRIAGQLLTGSKQLRIATDKDHLYEQEWQAWLAIGHCT